MDAERHAFDYNLSMPTFDLFLFDLDDTLLDFKASEQLSFERAMKGLGLQEFSGELFPQYQLENRALWAEFELGKVSKEHLKVERFRRIFSTKGIGADPALASQRYLDALPETVVLVENAESLCRWLAARGEIGIVTNGIEAVQIQRIQNSPLAPFISFVSVSEACGFAKPDIRFFEHSMKMAKSFSRESAIVIGDRLEIDVLGAQNFGVASCWFNPSGLPNSSSIAPDFEIKGLLELKRIFG